MDKPVEKSAGLVRFQFLLFSVGAALVAVGLCRLFLLHEHAPSDVVATHWNRAGQPDGSMAVSELLSSLSIGALAPAVVSIALVALRVPLESQPTWPIGLTAFSAFLGTLVTSVAWSTASLNHETARWQEAAPMPGTHLAVVITLPLLLGTGSALVAKRLWPTRPSAPPEAPALSVAPDERIVWLGRAHAGAWLWIGLPLSAILAGTSARLTGTFPAILLFFVSVLLADAFSTLRVTVDRRGLGIRYGHLGLFRQLIPLAKIVGAKASSIRPMDHGGWGYRGSLTLLNKVAVVVRGGDAIELTLSEARQFLVTVDDAATGAALLNGLVRQ